MKFTPNTIVFLGGLFSAAAIVTASPVVPDPKSSPFGLRAWHDSRHDPTPAGVIIDNFVEIDPDTGNAIINRTASYPGFPSYIDPTPAKGTLNRLKPPANGYLFPLHDPTIPAGPPHYQLKYTSGIPRIAGVLYQEFISVGRDCGAMCGGVSLDYYLGGNRGFGEWYVYPITSNCGRKVWTLRWIALKSVNDIPVYPEGAVRVYLWKPLLS